MSKELKKSAVEYAIRETAAKGKAYNVGNLTDERKAQHVSICKAIVEFADSHKDIPMYFILSTNVQGYPKKSVYAKGYQTFSGKRVETIFRRCKAIVKAMGCPEVRTFDSLSRIVAKYTDQFGNDPVKFAKAVKAMAEKLPNMGKGVVARENYVEVCEALGIDAEQRITTKRTATKTDKATKKSKKTA